MLHSVDLNQIVLQGKEEALIHIRQLMHYPAVNAGEDRAAHVARMTHEQKFNYVLSTEIMLSMKNNAVEIDLSHMRQLLLDENAEILSTLPDGSRDAIKAIAQASGRVTQINECIAAMGRVGETYDEQSAAVFEWLARLETALREEEVLCVKIIRSAEGELVLGAMGGERDVAALSKTAL